MALVEKILGKPAGESVRLKADICLINDGEGHASVDGAGRLNASGLVVAFDHDVPAGSFESAAIQKKLIAFARDNNTGFFQAQGIAYQVLSDTLGADEGQIIVSCGRHNGFFGAKGSLGLRLDIAQMKTYLAAGEIPFTVPRSIGIELTGILKAGVRAADFIYGLFQELGPDYFKGYAVEFFGAGSKSLTLSDRIVLCGTATQAEAVTALMTDGSGPYAKKITRDLTAAVPVVVSPGDLYSARPIEQFDGVPVHACFIGGCNGGRIEDLRIAAGILKGKRVKVGVRAMFGFASNAVHLQALEEGLVDIFLDSGAQVTNPGCGSCRTTSIGVVGDGENMLTTGSYNYPGCAGTPDSQVYIASADAVARAALSGFIFGGR